MHRQAPAVLVICALFLQEAFACGSASTAVQPPSIPATPPLIRAAGWHPLWMNERLTWNPVFMYWESEARGYQYFSAEIAAFSDPDRRFIHPATGETYNSIAALPRLSEWGYQYRATRIVRFLADARVVAYGIYVEQDYAYCGPTKKFQHDRVFWDRKHGANYCREIRPMPKDEEAPPPVSSSSMGVLGCVGVPYINPYAPQYRWEVEAEYPPSILFTDQDGDGVFERYDFRHQAPIPEWANSFAKVNRRIRTKSYMEMRFPVTPEMLQPRTTVVFGSAR
jgi:hypothetical protein